MVDIKLLDKIVNETVSLIEGSRNRIFEIADGARNEYSRLEGQLRDIREQVTKCIQQVDAKEREARLKRIRLMEVSRDFKYHTETDIKRAYETAQASQLELVVLQEHERSLRLQRDSIERALRNLEDTVKKAEQLVSQVGVATEVLRGNLKELSGQLDTMQQRQWLGLRIIRAQEEERRRLARDMHDGPAQMLANVMLRAEICERLLDADLAQVRGELRSLKEVVRGSIKDIRKVIFDLRPMALDDLGLVPALKRYISDVKEQRGLLVELSVQGLDRRMPSVVEVASFRIVQEGLNNVLKHARAAKVQVKIEFGKDALLISITDDGQGFAVDEALTERGEHFGLLSMRERVQLLEGTCQIESAPGRGASIMVRLPIREGGENGGA
ncbi:MAG: Signal transduction histidine-protein kinase/phosphatase DegS [Firmicutes bacterium]|nr:Signal transduction histidine-protein kinase/phosphatase DegS [candidate division NPL-UPA2 bacterium]MBT9155559.1 Signal transduction histidine-protein kinase/phosphatase DegS [candidate division NPL-UPA2 bacterium]